MNQNPILRFDLDINEINAVLAGLQELPGKVCNPLSEKIKLQAQPQIQALQEAEAKNAEDDTSDKSAE